MEQLLCLLKNVSTNNLKEIFLELKMSNISYTDEQYVQLFKILRDLGIITKVTEWKEERLYYCKIEYHSDRSEKLVRVKFSKISKWSPDSRHAARSSVIKDLIDFKDIKKSTLALADKVLDDIIVIINFTETYSNVDETTVELIYEQDDIVYKYSDNIFKNIYYQRKRFYKEILSNVCSHEDA